MAFFEAIRMALGALNANKTRSALTLLGMVIGVFAIIVSVTAVEVIDVYFKEKLQFLGSSTFQISRTPSIQMGPNRAGRNRPPITYEQVQRFSESMQLPVDISIIEDFTFGAVRYGSVETAEPNITLLGTDHNMLGNFSHEIDQGRFFTEQDILYARPVIVLGSQVAEELFVNETPLGKQIRMDGHRYEVIGVLKEKGNFLGFSQDNRVYTPITRGFTLYGIPNRNMASISVRVRDAVYMQAAMEEATGRMRLVRKVPPGEDNNFEVSTNDSMQSVFDSFTGTLSTAGGLIGLIALLAAGVGIMNIMLVSVTERTREIGIRKSIGARRKDILRQFLIEAFVLCQIGGLTGILLGVLVGNYVAVYFDISAAVPMDWAIGSVMLVTIMALVFGGYPAWKAARLDPIQSLRYE